MYSYGSPHMAAQKQDDQHERTFSSYVRIRDVVLKTYLGRWTIGRSGERGSGISVLPVRDDDDDDDENGKISLFDISYSPGKLTICQTSWIRLGYQLSFKKHDNSMCLIFFGIFWLVHIPLSSWQKISFLYKS